MSGFMPSPDPAYKPTIGEAIDFRLELDEQTLEALDARVTNLERRVAFLESLLLDGGEKDRADGPARSFYDGGEEDR